MQEASCMEESTNVIEKNDALNFLLATVGQLFHGIYDLLVLTATFNCQSNLPRALVEPILYPEFVGSYFPGRGFYNQLVRCEHLIWSLTGESVESFNQIVCHRVQPTPAITLFFLIFGTEYYWCSFDLECTQKLQCLVGYL